MIADKIDFNAVNQQLANVEPPAIVQWAAETFRDGLVMTSSFGAESALMIHMVTRVIPDIPVITIDTGYLFQQTYRFMDELAKRFKLNLRIYQSPVSPARMEALQGELWKTDINRYDQLRKVEPMERAIRELGVKAWLSGVRADQTDHRKTLNIVERRADGVVKVHPILKWTKREIESYFIIHDLPFHPLVAEGYSSIGDHHSTLPSEGREGRFMGLKQECGLHLPATKAENESREASDL